MNANDMLSPITINRQPLEPIETDVAPKLESLDDIRVVVFDVYGTLVVSGSGDVGVADERNKANRVVEAFSAVGFPSPDGELVSQTLRKTITETNAACKSDSCPKPEVDIVDVWRQTLCKIGLDDFAIRTADVVRLACEYESRANPTWPMPGAKQLLHQLRSSGLPLGIVSNAQVFTIPLVEDIAGETFQKNGFDLNLCVFSNRFRQAKPGPRMFDVLCGSLQRCGLGPKQAVYVGNDMLNDVWAASQAGLRTAWFAGDQRSCRPRSGDPRCQSLEPDVVLTDLLQLPQCLQID